MCLTAVEPVSGDVLALLALDHAMPSDPRNTELAGWAAGELKAIAYDEVIIVRMRPRTTYYFKVYSYRPSVT